MPANSGYSDIKTLPIKYSHRSLDHSINRTTGRANITPRTGIDREPTTKLDAPLPLVSVCVAATLFDEEPDPACAVCVAIAPVAGRIVVDFRPIPPGPKETDEWSAPIDVVLTGAFDPIRYVVPLMIASVPSTVNVMPSAVTTRKGCMPGKSVVLAKPTPPGPNETET
jgi:hypothetical protein